MPPYSKIIGSGSAFPSQSVSNAEIAHRLASLDPSITAQWIFERTGIQNRNISNPENPSETCSGLAHMASLRALEMAGLEAQKIDAILLATYTPDSLTPAMACRLQGKLGAHQAFAMDLNAACSGFVYGLYFADLLIREGRAKNVLIVGADVSSRFMNWKDPNTCILFGDGAGAVILSSSSSSAKSSTNDSAGIRSIELGSDGSQESMFDLPCNGFLKMEGTNAFKAAVRTMVQMAQKTMEQNQLSMAELDWVLPHQANLRILEAVAKRLDWPMEKMIIQLDRVGNTAAASIPCALDQAVRSGQIQKGHKILLDAYGAGVTYATALIEW